MDTGWAHIRRLRVERGWTQRELAERAGVDRATVQRIEEGQGRVRKATLARIYAALGAPLPPDLSPEMQQMLTEIERDVLDEDGGE
jgi:transcriptional regulator with XRE-family HTH domain